MINTAVFVVLAMFGGYTPGASDGFSGCVVNPNPPIFSFQTFHAMPDDPDNQIPIKCLFALPKGEVIRGAFHFGFSEMEYDQHWYVDEKERVLTTRSAGEWVGNENPQWVVQHRAGKGVYSLDGNRVMLGKEVVGYLVYVEVAGKKQVGLVDLSTQDAKAVEVGFYTPFEKALVGQTPQASRVLLTPDYLKLFSKAELKIMRNEIFARYGHRFKKGGAMEKHFQAQSWYQKLAAPQKAIQSLLSSVEKENISLIRKAEKR